jgi:hypothetical protein
MTGDSGTPRAPSRLPKLAELGVEIAAAALALWAFLPGIGWGTPSPGRLDLLLPDAARRAADLATLIEPVPEYSVTLSPYEDGPACFGPIDLTSRSDSAQWLRWEMVPYMLSSDDPDEMETFSSIGKLFRDRSRLDSRSFLYGHVYLAAVASAEGLAVAVGALPALPRRSDLVVNPGLMHRLYIVGRLTSVAALSLLAVTLARFLLRAGLGFAGTIAGIVGLFGPMVMAAARIAKPHAFAACFGFIAFALAWRAVRDMHLALWVAHAAALALAISASPPYAVLLACLPAALLATQSGIPLRRLLTHSLAFAVTLVVAVVALNPLALVHPNLVASNASRQLAGSGWGYGLFSLAKLLSFCGRLVLDGLPLCTVPLALLGLVVAVVERRPFRTYLVIVSLVAGIILGGFIGVPRIALVLAPLAAALGAVGVCWLATPGGRGWRRAGLGIAVLLLGLSIVEVGISRGAGTHPEDRDTAGAWINENVPAGRCIALRTRMPMATFLPRFALQRYRLQILPMDDPGSLRDLDADFLVLTAPDVRADPWLSRTDLVSRYHVVATFAGDSRPAWLMERWMLQGRRQVVVLARQPFEEASPGAPSTRP